MTAFRLALLVVATDGSHIAITIVQQIVEEDVELTRIQSDCLVSDL
jgi:GTP cyclohydrolase II